MDNTTGRGSARRIFACLLLGSACLESCGPVRVPIQTGSPVANSAPGTETLVLGARSTAVFGGGSTSVAQAPLDAEESAFLGLINVYRADNGVSALKLSPELTASSKWMSNDMASRNYFSHTDSLGRDPFTRMSQFGYDYDTDEGENIAAGNATATDTFSQWEASPEHNANMLDASYGVIGIGRAYSASSTYGWYWTTDFGGYGE